MSPADQTTQATESADTPKWRPSAFHLILAGLFGGIAVGLVLGDYASVFDVAGRAYVGLLQMTVLPYIIVSIVGNIGKMSGSESARLAVAGLKVLAVLWAVGLLTVWIIPAALPSWETGAFFSTSLLEREAEADLFNLFIPSNPFASLASNYAPAVVLFCILFGTALIGADGKDRLLDLLDVANAALAKVNGYVVRFAPLGTFAIAASAAGTMTFEQFGRLQGYLAIYIGASLLVTFWVVPMLIASVTSLRYRDVLAESREALVTAFVIGSTFAVIPMLIEAVKSLFARHGLESGHADHHETPQPEFFVPLGYAFPHLGKVVTLIFVPFAAWFYGEPIGLFEYPRLLLTGLVLSFGKVVTTIPFLLEMQRLPADIFQLFMMSGVIAGRFSDLLGAAHLIAFAVIAGCAMNGTLTFDARRAVTGLAGTVVLAAMIMGSTNLSLDALFRDRYDEGSVIQRMSLRDPGLNYRVLETAAPHPMPLTAGMTRSERAVRTGYLRVGFHPDNLPFSYFNESGELVGFDIDMAHRLGKDTGVAIEFVPFAFGTLGGQIAKDHFDIAMSGLGLSLTGTQFGLFTDPYLSVTLALVVRDHDEDLFQTAEDLLHSDAVVGVTVNSFFAERARTVLPEARIVELRSERQFFEDPPQHLDALVTSAEEGSAWTLIHPHYAVITSPGRKMSVPLGILVAGRDEDLADRANLWIRLKQQDGTIAANYDYWILGRGAEVSKRRWSVIRDVLGWVD